MIEAYTAFCVVAVSASLGLAVAAGIAGAIMQIVRPEQ